MEKRIFVAVVISIAFLALWSALIPKFFPEMVKKPAPAAKPAVTSTSMPISAAATPKSPVKPQTSNLNPESLHVAPLSATGLQPTILDTPDFTATFSNRGAELVSFKLKHYTTADKQPVELVKAREPERTDFPFSIEAKDAQLTERINFAPFAVTEKLKADAKIIEYRW